MAELINDRPLDDNDRAVLNTLAAQESPQQEQTQADAVPEKYKGKSATDLVRMHQEAEKAIGRQGQELGDLRRVVDDILVKQSEIITKKEPPQEVDFFADPRAAVTQTIDNHPALTELKQHTAAAKKASSQAELLRRHPDAYDLISDEEFIKYATASPTRKALLQQADRNLDVDAADELFSSYKERKNLLQQTVQSEKQARSSSVQAASTGSSRVSSEQGSTQKKYRRADIIKLMREDPDRYASLAGEIRRAYSENRVID
jgi:hypothetical protein